MHIYRSQQWIHIPTDQNLTELLLVTGRPLPETHVVASDSLTGRSITLGQLRDRAGRLARGIADVLQPPDQTRWAVVLPNSVDFLETTHAILWTGGVVCPINAGLKKPAEIGHALASAGRSLWWHMDRWFGWSRAVAKAAEELAATAVDVQWERPTILTAVERCQGWLHLEDLLRRDRLPIPHYADTRQRVATIHLSSGTTGQPKGVQLTHYNFVANVRQLFAHDPQQFHAGYRSVTFTPWAHIGMTTLPLFGGPYMGLCHHAMPSFDFGEFAQLAEDMEATAFQGPPSVVLRLANKKDNIQFKFPHAQVLHVGGTPLRPEMLQSLLQKAPWQLVQVYGMTEAAGYVAFQRLGEQVPEGAVGRLLPNLEARLRRTDDRDAEEGEAGELWLRGPNMTRGYVFVEGKGKKKDKCKNENDNEWHNTGDVCTIDTQGFLRVVGRTKDLIKYRGFQVSPAELEMHLNSHPLVVEAGVAGVWDQAQLTEVPTAWVVLGSVEGRRPVREALREIHTAVDAQVSGYKKLRGGVWQVQILPKNATGKVLRRQLVAMRDGPSSLEKEWAAKL